jgi:hypothetical protein
MNWLGILLLLVPQAAKPAAIPDMPAASGVYYRQSDTRWIRLPPAPIAEVNTRGMRLFIETGGYTSLGRNIVCRGAKAKVRISAPKPIFYVREAGSSEDLMLIRLAQQKDTRTCETSSADASVGNKPGFRKEDVHKMAVTEYPDHSFSVTPEENLKPGEYLLTFGTVTAGFDFGIDPEK